MPDCSEIHDEELTSAGTVRGARQPPRKPNGPSKKRRNQSYQQLVKSERGPTTEELREPDHRDELIRDSDFYKHLLDTPGQQVALTGERSIESCLRLRQSCWSFDQVKDVEVGDVGQISDKS